MLKNNKREKKNFSMVFHHFLEKIMPTLFRMTALVSVLATFGILFTLLTETFHFFEQVSFIEFLTGRDWYPFFADDPSYGIWPLLSGTFLITVIAMSVSVPIGLASAIYLSEYAPERVRKIIKPSLEVLAGVPTIVYGLFALTFVTPVLKSFLPSLPIFNALSPGIVVGIMIIPQITSLSEEAMGAVPQEIRDGALALGATRLEVTLKVVFPAALSGIISSILLGVSRAIGETMIVSTAAGSTPILGFNPAQSIQTMTSYMVQVSMGDATYGSITYYSIYAVGITLFLFTLLMNVLAKWVSNRFKEEY
ncbi:phosphate ABC transporter permease subunit PstC [Jeotgalibaca sp. MA1X17-3]|uniref:phosphate ABC transporter permease subunit PstC n=1 Tax=Jeotgalibaca sp. MA1X17-3 TaxID=2908211 RepID=UPI001F332311|nr:phosphate ABC transporter permease subunit PstC [Jeotgalibaca sp. MA1X17-3]UJF15501.1 phosphate ABC transporter permease subunit PstC [Jeotgalibaca sp. MA1X17-3]